MKKSITFNDANLILYYQNDTHARDLKKFFMERIDDSQVYIILFPTGLLLMVSINPLTITSKIQLNLKKDEQILDYKYSISQNGHNHCIWLLDQKMQVWKCSNERNPNQATWTLNRVAVYTHLTFKSFFNQATTYEDFFMTCSLSKLKCFKDANIHEHKIIINGIDLVGGD